MHMLEKLNTSSIKDKNKIIGSINETDEFINKLKLEISDYLSIKDILALVNKKKLKEILTKEESKIVKYYCGYDRVKSYTTVEIEKIFEIRRNQIDKTIDICINKILRYISNPLNENIYLKYINAKKQDILDKYQNNKVEYNNIKNYIEYLNQIKTPYLKNKLMDILLWKYTNNKELKNDLIETNLCYVMYLILYKFNNNNNVSLMDLIQEGNTILSEHVINLKTTNKSEFYTELNRKLNSGFKKIIKEDKIYNNKNTRYTVQNKKDINIEEEAIKNILKDEIKKTINKIPNIDKKIINMILDNYSISEISKNLNMSIKNTEILISKILRNLRNIKDIQKLYLYISNNDFDKTMFDTLLDKQLNQYMYVKRSKHYKTLTK